MNNNLEMEFDFFHKIKHTFKKKQDQNLIFSVLNNSDLIPTHEFPHFEQLILRTQVNQITEKTFRLQLFVGLRKQHSTYEEVGTNIFGRSIFGQVFRTMNHELFQENIEFSDLSELVNKLKSNKALNDSTFGRQALQFLNKKIEDSFKTKAEKRKQLAWRIFKPIIKTELLGILFIASIFFVFTIVDSGPFSMMLGKGLLFFFKSSLLVKFILTTISGFFVSCLIEYLNYDSEKRRYYPPRMY